MKTKINLDKQDFAKLYFNICANKVRMYQYDAFYDICKLRNLEINMTEKFIYLYFRDTGIDIRYSNKDEKLHGQYFNNNDIVMCLNFIPDRSDNNGHIYNITVLKDKTNFLTEFSLKDSYFYNKSLPITE